MPAPTLFIILALALISGSVLFAGSQFLRRFNSYTKQLATCGFVPPQASPLQFACAKLIAWSVTGFQVGLINWRGRENLKCLNEPNGVLVVCNHVSYTDATIMLQTLNKPARYMAGAEVFQRVYGLIGRIIVLAGGFAISRSSSSGMAIEVASRILKSGQTLVIFPEGACQFDGEMTRFRNGAAVIARAAAQQSGAAITILPVHLHYNKLPGSWIRALSPNASILHMIRNFADYRRGAIVSIGTPFSSNELPQDIGSASQTLRVRVEECAAVR